LRITPTSPSSTPRICAGVDPRVQAAEHKGFESRHDPQRGGELVLGEVCVALSQGLDGVHGLLLG
jgi:hypothetical protein